MTYTPNPAYTTPFTGVDTNPDANAPLPEYIYNLLLQYGASPAQAAGIVGNMIAESSINPESVAMDSNGAYSRGLISWNDKGAGSGVDWSNYITGNVRQDAAAQVQLLISQGGLAAATGNTAAEAANSFMMNFERPAVDNGAAREGFANNVVAALNSGDWSKITSASTTGGPAGAPGTTATPGTQASSGAPAPPGMNDIPGLVQYIQQYLGADAWLLNVDPQVAKVIEEAVATGHGQDGGYIQAQIEQTNWWKTTSSNLQSYEQNKAQNPANYSFSTPGSIASQQLADIKTTAASIGVTASEAELQSLAQQSIMYNWDANQLKAALGASIYVTSAGKTNAGAVLTQLQSAASQYLMPVTDPVLQSWAQNIAAGTQTVEQFDAYLKQNASLKWTGMASQIAQGYTPNQIVDNLRTTAAQTMETSPTSIDFINNPLYSKILDYVPPGSPDGVHRMMTQSETSQYLKSQPQWWNTQQARDQGAQLEQAIVQGLGKVAG